MSFFSIPPPPQLKSSHDLFCSSPSVLWVGRGGASALSLSLSLSSVATRTHCLGRGAVQEDKSVKKELHVSKKYFMNCQFQRYFLNMYSIRDTNVNLCSYHDPASIHSKPSANCAYPQPARRSPLVRWPLRWPVARSTLSACCAARGPPLFCLLEDLELPRNGCQNKNLNVTILFKCAVILGLKYIHTVFLDFLAFSFNNRIFSCFSYFRYGF